MSFVSPTCRLHEVEETVEQYADHFWRNGHSVLMVFDISSPANQQKYDSLLERRATHNELNYVGPREKEQFIAFLNERLPDKRLQGLVKRPETYPRNPAQELSPFPPEDFRSQSSPGLNRT